MKGRMWLFTVRFKVWPLAEHCLGLCLGVKADEVAQILYRICAWLLELLASGETNSKSLGKGFRKCLQRFPVEQFCPWEGAVWPTSSSVFCFYGNLDASKLSRQLLLFALGGTLHRFELNFLISHSSGMWVCTSLSN